jgi:hypothetical protein
MLPTPFVFSTYGSMSWKNEKKPEALAPTEEKLV